MCLACCTSPGVFSCTSACACIWQDQEATGIDGQLLAPGMQVTVCGLVKRPELNGMDAKVLRFDEHLARYEVALADGKEIALRS